MIADANRKAILTALEATEAQGGMAGVLPPQQVVLGGQPLNVGWQGM
jgi:hypothetical protein